MAEIQPQNVPMLTIGDGTGNGAVLLPKPGSSITIDGQPIEKIQIKGYDKNHIELGVEGARLAKKITDPKTGTVTHPELPYDPGGSIPENTVDGVLIRDKNGADIFFEMSEFTIEPTETNPTLPTESIPSTPLVTLEKRATEQPKSISLIGLDVDQIIQAQAGKDMEKLNQTKNIISKIWKGNIAHELMEEHAYQFRKKQVDAAHMMLSDETFTLIGSRADQLYDADMTQLKKDNKIAYAWTKIKDYIADKIGGYTTSQTYAITIAGDMFTNGELTDIEHYEQGLEAVRSRFEKDFLDADGVIRKNLGENLDILQSGDLRHQEIINGIKDLVHKYVNGDFKSKQELDAVISEFAKAQGIGADPKTTREAQLYASSLYQIANESKARIESGVGLNAIDEELNKMEIRIGRAQMGEATQVVKTDTRKTVEWLLQKNIAGTLVVNESVLGTAVAAALSLVVLPRMGVTKILARTSFAAVGGGAIAGAIAGLKENARMKHEWFQYMRQRETGGGSPEPGDKLRLWMAAREIKQVSIDELISRMTTAHKNEDEIQTLAYLADAKARRAISARGGANVSLIQGGPAVDVGRANLDLSIDKLERDLQAKFGQTITDRLNILTDAQTRVLVQGRSVANLEDPLKIALDAVKDNDIGVQKFRRQLGVWGKTTTKGETQGLDAALKDIKTQIALEATRRGISSAVIGSAIGTILTDVPYVIAHHDQVWTNIQHVLHTGPMIETHIASGTQLASVPGIVPIPDAHGSLHIIQTIIPKNTSLINDPATHTYTLMDINNHALIHGIAINDHGQITNGAILNTHPDAVAHGLHFGDNTSVTIPGTGGTDGTGGTFDISAPEGEWNWALQHIQSAGIHHQMPADNFQKNLFRVWTDSQHIPITGTEFHNVPTLFAHDNQIIMGHAMDHALGIRDQIVVNGHLTDANMPNWHDMMALIEKTAAADPTNATDPHVLALMYKIGVVDQPATQADFDYILTHLSGGVPTPSVTIFQGSISQMLTHVTKVVPPWTEIVTPVPAVVPLPREGMRPGTESYFTPPSLDTTILRYPMSYYGYESGQSFLTEKQYTDRRSPELSNNPNATLNQQQEVKRYLSTLSETDNDNLQELLAQHDTPISAETRAIICIPSFKEAANIYTTLEQYLHQVDGHGQPIDPKKFEIVIFDNHPKSIQPDQTHEQVQKFTSEHPELSVIYLHKAYETRQTIGRIRRDLSNFVLKRLENRDASAPDVLLLSNDADVLSIKANYISTAIQEFDTNPRLDAITGKTDFPKEAYTKFPSLFASERAWQFLDSIVHHKQKSVPQLKGANSAFRASTFAATGGYNELSHLGEDLEIGWMIASARQYKSDRIKLVNRFGVVTDPRRAIYKRLKGSSFMDRYGDFANNEDIRDKTWEELAQTVNDRYTKEFLEKDLTDVHNSIFGWLKNSDPEVYEHYFKRAMDFLGVTYETIDNKIVITDDTKLREGLDRYKTYST